MMTFLTTLLTPYLLTLSFQLPGKSTRKPVSDEDQQEQIRFAMPSAETSEWMTYHVVQAFEQEDFFVRPFGLRKEIFQIRKEDLLITFRPSPTHLTFNCRRSAKPLIYTVTYEVLADLERTIRNLKQLTESKDIGRQILSSPPDSETPKKTRLSDALSPVAVECRLKSTDKESVLREMIDLLDRSGRIDPKAKEGILKDVLEREKGMSTGMQEGIAMPHARSRYVEQLHCAVGISKKGVDFKSIDGKPARLFVLIVAPKDSAGRYLQFMASISQLLSDPKRRKQILKAKTNEELYLYLDGG
jgi:mannitol/fructose-specific phosphotransferase system IIA component (Ntr-type)